MQEYDEKSMSKCSRDWLKDGIKILNLNLVYAKQAQLSLQNAFVFRGKAVVTDKRFKLLPDGSLYINAVVGSDAANYTCQAENTHGTDQIVYAVSVQGQLISTS